MILQYFFPLAVLVFTYTRIALAVWGKKAPGEAEDGRDQRLAKAKRKVRNCIHYYYNTAYMYYQRLDYIFSLFTDIWFYYFYMYNEQLHSFFSWYLIKPYIHLSQKLFDINPPVSLVNPFIKDTMYILICTLWHPVSYWSWELTRTSVVSKACGWWSVTDFD